MEELDDIYDDEVVVKDPELPIEDVEKDTDDGFKFPGADEENEDGDPEKLEAPTENPAATDPAKPSVLHSLLESLGIEGGMVDFEDGESSHIDGFDTEHQTTILKELLDHYRKTSAVDSTLSPEEIELINGHRNGKSIDEVIEERASELAQARLNHMDFPHEVAYEKMSEDEIFLAFLQAEHGEDKPTDAELAEELEIAKELKSFTATVKALRNNFISGRETQRQEWQGARNKQADELRDKEASFIVDNVRNLKDVGGWSIDDASKNEILGKLIEVDENGDSHFMKNVMGNPQKMFEAMWYLEKGPDMFSRMDAYYKNEIKKLKEISKSTPVTQGKPHRVTTIKKDVNKSTSIQETKNKGAKVTDDLYDN